MATGSPIKPSPYEDSELLGVVRDVAAHLHIDDPGALTQPIFDDNKEAAGHPLSPTAKRISARLHASWPEVRVRALDVNASAAHVAGKRRGAADSACSLEEAASALRLVALRRDLSAVSQRIYIEERNLLVRADQRRWKHGGRVDLPTVGQMLRGRTWEAIEDAAGLDHAAEARDAPVTQVPSPDGVLVRLIERALEIHGALPALRDLEAFAKAIDAQHPRRRKPYLDYVQLLREQRAVRGLWTPARVLPKKERPDFATLPDGIAADGSRRVKRWTREGCIESLIAAIELAGGELTERRYHELAAGNREIAPYKSVTAFGRFAELRDEARRLRRARLGSGQQRAQT